MLLNRGGTLQHRQTLAPAYRLQAPVLAKQQVQRAIRGSNVLGKPGRGARAFPVLPSNTPCVYARNSFIISSFTPPRKRSRNNPRNTASAP